jgi:heptosyltransferase III
MAPPRQSILVISLRYFGDVLLTTPLIRSLRRGFEGAAIDVLLNAGTEGMLEGNPDVRAVLTIAERPGASGHLALVRRLWRRYDLAVIAETGDRPHLYGWIAASQRAGLLAPEPGKRWWKEPLLRHRVALAANEPRVDGYRRLAEAMALPFAAQLVAPTSGTPASEWGARLGFDPAREPYAVLHLAPRFRYKRWHRDGWHRLIAWIAARGLRVTITGGNAPAERDYVGQVLAGSELPIVDLTGRLRFAETADLLRGAALYVGPDTATSHLAAACGTPSVVLFGPTDPRLWGPLPAAGLDRPYEKVAPAQRRANVLLLQEDSLPCVPCQQEGCERHRESYSACLDRMSAVRVIDAAQILTRSATRTAPLTRM